MNIPAPLPSPPVSLRQLANDHLPLDEERRKQLWAKYPYKDPAIWAAQAANWVWGQPEPPLETNTGIRNGNFADGSRFDRLVPEPSSAIWSEGHIAPDSTDSRSSSFNHANQAQYPPNPSIEDCIRSPSMKAERGKRRRGSSAGSQADLRRQIQDQRAAARRSNARLRAPAAAAAEPTIPRSSRGLKTRSPNGARQGPPSRRPRLTIPLEEAQGSYPHGIRPTAPVPLTTFQPNRPEEDLPPLPRDAPPPPAPRLATLTQFPGNIPLEELILVGCDAMSPVWSLMWGSSLTFPEAWRLAYLRGAGHYPWPLNEPVRASLGDQAPIEDETKPIPTFKEEVPTLKREAL